MMNDKVGVVLAVGTPDPWGYPGGSILDAGRVISVPAGATDLKDAALGEDTVLTVQFLFDRWDEWAPINTGMVYFDLVRYDFQAHVLDDDTGIPAVQVTRKYLVPYTPAAGVPTPRDLDVVSYYGIAPGSDYVCMFDTIRNNGDAFSSSCANEVSLSNKGGDGIDTKTIMSLSAANTYNWIAGPNGDPVRQFSTTLICPGDNPGSDGRNHPFTVFRGAKGYRELGFADVPYVAGESRLYESYLMIDDECSWQKVYDFWADYKGLDQFSVSGNVTDDQDQAVAYPVVMVYRGSTLHGWVVGDDEGRYEIDLPNENDVQQYHLKVAKSGTIEGPASSTFTSATVPVGGMDLEAGDSLVPVTFHFQDQNGNPVWGRVSVGQAPTIAFTGTNYFFSDDAADGSVAKGDVTAMIAPGDYTARCWGEGFRFYSYTSATDKYDQTVTGATSTDPDRTVTIQKSLKAPIDWFGIDPHHHGWRADAFSPPEDVAKAQITAGLEVLTLDDHEHTLDNCRVYDWARKMDALGYMPSEEITASWAHFDAVPLTQYAFDRWLDREQQNLIVDTNLPLQGIIDDAHQAGLAIGANHPNYSYGLFLADDHDTVPGGMTDDFDGIEVQTHLEGAFGEAMSFWNAYVTDGTCRGVSVRRPHYLYGSTDTHECGTGTGSGAVRSYVYVKDGAAKSTADFDAFSLEFSRSFAVGHSFNSTGVFVTPTSGKIFGNTYRTDPSGNFTARYKIASLNNITDVYTFGSTGSGTATGFFGLENLVSHRTYTDPSTTRNFTLDLHGVEGRQWYAIAAISSTGQYAFTNPIWVNGPDVALAQSITSVRWSAMTSPQVAADGSLVAQPPTAVLTTTPWSGFLFADWQAVGDVGSGVYTLTFAAPAGFAFDDSLADPSNGMSVSDDGSLLTHMVDKRGPTSSIAGARAGWVRDPVKLTFSADDGSGSGVDFIEYKIGGGDWTKGSSLSLSTQGVTDVACRAVDLAGNIGPQSTCTVKIDRVGPKTQALGSGPLLVKKGKKVTVRLKVTDNLSVKAKVTLEIKNRKGKVVARWAVGNVKTAKALKYTRNVGLARGTYTCVILAKDQAGNAQVKAGTKRLIVR